jgi:hypothetical protein
LLCKGLGHCSMAFQKGISGNPGGKRQGRPWREAIERAVARRRGKKDLKGIDDIADKLLDVAASGDMQAVREFGDRMDGKAPQSLEHSGVIATTHEENLKQLDNLPDDSDGEEDTP